MAARRPYVRSMDGWWTRVPFFKRYMAREVTAFFVAAYGLEMLCGLVQLAKGPEAFDAWMQQMRSGWSITLHLLLLMVFVYHTYSWFEIMPKTMPTLFIGGRRIAQSTIIRAGWAAAVAATLLLVAMAWWLR